MVERVADDNINGMTMANISYNREKQNKNNRLVRLETMVGKLKKDAFFNNRK